MQSPNDEGSTAGVAARHAAVLTIDTEPDDAWSDHRCERVANVRALRRLGELLGRFGVRPTLLVTWRVIHDEECRGIIARLLDDCGAEVGTHLHPWETPPFLHDQRDVLYPAFPHELPVACFAEKMQRLTDAIAAHFDRPTSYRAGRWGLAGEHLPVLERLGYEVDTSVHPLVDWRDTFGVPRDKGGRGGVDYRHAPQRPYHPAYDDITRAGDAAILEIPLSAGLNRRVPDALRGAIHGLPSLAIRALRKSGAVRTVWATPAWEKREHLLRLTRRLIDDGEPVINVACHSSEFVVSRLPECDSQAKIDEIFGRCEAMFETMAAQADLSFMTLTQAARHVASQRSSFADVRS